MFWAEGTACAKTSRWETVWHLQATKRPKWLEACEGGGGLGAWQGPGPETTSAPLLASWPRPPRPAPERGSRYWGQGWVNNKVTVLLPFPLLQEHKELFLLCLLIALIKLSLKNLRGVHQWGLGSLQALA